MRELDTSPYISISGVVNEAQVAAIDDRPTIERLAELGRATLIGVQVSDDTIFNEQEDEHGKDWYPVGKNIGMPFRRTKEAGLPPSKFEGALHVNPYFHDSSYAAALAKIAFLQAKPQSGEKTESIYDIPISTLQLDGMDLSDSWHFKRISKALGLSRLLVRFKGGLSRHESPWSIGHDVKRAEGTISGIVLDYGARFGINKQLDFKNLDATIEEIKNRDAKISIAIGSIATTHSFEEVLIPLLYKYPDLSIDSEVELREFNRYNKSIFSPEKANALLQRILAFEVQRLTNKTT